MKNPQAKQLKHPPRVWTKDEVDTLLEFCEVEAFRRVRVIRLMTFIEHLPDNYRPRTEATKK